MSCCNVKGYITAVNVKTGKVSAKALGGKTYSNIQLINPYNTNSIPKIAINMCIMIIKSGGSDGAVYGIPFNVVTQFELESEGDYAVGSVVGKNKIIFKASGDTVENANTKTINANTYTLSNYNEASLDGDVTNISSQMVNIEGNIEVNVDAEAVNLGDAIANVLNENAIMEVIITGGSSAGTYPVQITNAGQTKVKA